MAAFTTLPAELRQRILGLALPDSIVANAPYPLLVMNLLHICRSLRTDGRRVVERWSPIHIIQHPNEITSMQMKPLKIDGYRCGARVQRVCLDIFHDADTARINHTCYCSHPGDWSHPELVAAWQERVPGLTRFPELSEVQLDITPAPSWMRTKPRYVINPFIHDKRASSKFLGEHIEDLGALIALLHDCLGTTVQILLAGRISTRSKFLPNLLAHRFEDRNVQFVGQCIDTDAAARSTIFVAVERIAPRQKVNREQLDGSTHLLRPFRNVAWSAQTASLWMATAEDGGLSVAEEYLTALAHLMGSADPAQEYQTRPEPNRMRKLVHLAAHDMGLKTRSSGDSEARFVLITKR